VWGPWKEVNKIHGRFLKKKYENQMCNKKLVGLELGRETEG